MREWLLPQAGRRRDHPPGGLTAAAQRTATSSVDATRAGDRPAGGTAVPRGKNVRRAGEDFAAGAVLVPAGRRLRPGDLAAAAAGGHASVPVARQPVVAIIPTGDEIRPPGSTRAAGRDPRHQLAHARRPVPSAQRGAGAERDPAGRPGRARGRDPPLRPSTPTWCWSSPGRAGAGATTRPRCSPRWAASPSPAWRSGPATRRCSATPSARASAARSAAAGRAGIAPVIGLPGYPLATAVIFELFAAPLLAALQGAPPGGQARRCWPRSTGTGRPRPASRTGCW